MSSPNSGGGQRFVVPRPPAPGVMLTEYAVKDQPLQIINLSTDRVWLADSSSVGPSSGVPLEGGTSLPWTTQGQVWAIADESAGGSVTLVVSGSVTDWAPSPAAIALQVAEQLLLSGIPNVYTEATVFDAAIGGVGGGPVTLDLSGYASISVIESGGPRDSGVRIDWISTDPAIADIISSDFVHGTARLPCVSGKAVITSLLGATQAITLKVLGTNRAVERSRSAYTEKIDHWSLANNPWVAGTTYDFNHEDPLVALDGECYLYVIVSGSQAIRGRFIIRQLFGNIAFTPPVDVPFAALEEAIVSGATVLLLNKWVSMPAVPWTIGFICTTGTAGNATIDLYLTRRRP